MPSEKWISCLLIFTLLASYLPVIPVSAQEEKVTVAVYELTAKEVSEGMVSILSDVLRDAIFQTGKYNMLTREDMQQILENMAEKQQVSPDCASDKCIAEIAGALGVEMMVTGSVGKVGETFVINLRLIDTVKAHTINTTSLTCRCKVDDMIERVKDAGLKLLKIKSKKEQELEAERLKRAEAARKEEQKKAEAARKAEDARKIKEAKEAKRLQREEAARKERERKEAAARLKEEKKRSEAARKAEDARKIKEESKKSKADRKRELAKKKADERERKRSRREIARKKRQDSTEVKSSKAWLWWTLGILVVGGGAAAAAGGGSSGGGSSGGGGGETTPSGDTTGTIEVRWN